MTALCKHIVISSLKQDHCFIVVELGQLAPIIMDMIDSTCTLEALSYHRCKRYFVGSNIFANCAILEVRIKENYKPTTPTTVEEIAVAEISVILSKIHEQSTEQ